MKELNNRIFYNASDAYIMSKNAEEQHQYKELSELFDKIDMYVKTGCYECNIIGLTEFQKQWLIDNNYKISKINEPGHFTNGMIKINWNKNE